jgi:tetratricopeptide (TPR) repeat protein
VKELDAIRELREKDLAAYVEAISELAAKHPSSAIVRREAAYALDASGDEEAAISHYDAAYEMGLPDDDGPDFALSYGAILRSLGRFELALAILGEATIHFPDYAPLRIVLALTLQSAGHSDAAVATLLEVILQLGAGDDALDGYEESLAELQRQLLVVPDEVE